MTARFAKSFGPRTANLFATRLAITDALHRYSCPATCKNACCTSPGIRVDVTLFDLLLIAAERGTSLDALVRRHVRLSVVAPEMNDTLDPYFWRLGFQMESPCPFLQHGACSVHRVKPLACRTFPELAHADDGILATARSLPANAILPCFADDVDVSYARTDRSSVQAVVHRSFFESTFSDLLIFRVSPCIVPIKPFVKEIDRLSRTMPDEKPTDAATLAHNARNADLQQRFPGIPQYQIHQAAVEHVLSERLPALKDLRELAKRLADPHFTDSIVALTEEWMQQMSQLPHMPPNYRFSVGPDASLIATPK